MMTAATKLKDMLLGRKAMTKVDSILKSGDIALPTKVDIVKAMVFPGVMYGCESWAIKKTECRRIDVFELWCWRRLKKISPDYSLGGPVLKLKAPILWPPDVKD